MDDVSILIRKRFIELENPRFTQNSEQKIKQASKALRRKCVPKQEKEN